MIRGLPASGRTITDSKHTMDRGELSPVQRVTYNAQYLFCVGKKRNKPVDSAEIPQSTLLSLTGSRYVTCTCVLFVGSKKKAATDSVNESPKEKKRVSCLCGWHLLEPFKYYNYQIKLTRGDLRSMTRDEIITKSVP